MQNVLEYLDRDTGSIVFDYLVGSKQHWRFTYGIVLKELLDISSINQTIDKSFDLNKHFKHFRDCEHCRRFHKCNLIMLYSDFSLE